MGQGETRMTPPVVAVVANLKAPRGDSLEKCMQQQKDVEFLVANDVQSFLTEYGADKLATVEVICFAGFAGGSAKCVADLWPVCPKIRWVHLLSAGVDALVPTLRPLPGISEVAVTNAKGVYSQSLAEYSVMAMLYFNKQVPRIHENKRQKRWDQFIMPQLLGLTVGFVGYGDIAQTTALLCKPFGMRILALRRNKGGATDKCQADETLGIDNAEERMRLFSESDFVICSLPGTPATKHFCGAKEFAAMKKSSVFISIGRGMCVDEKSLCEALKSDSIAGAALDVFETEPLPESAPVWDAPNLIMTAHNADLTKAYIEDSWDLFISKTKEFSLAPDKFKGSVSLEAGY